jgi:hypothetical protein
VRSVMRDSILGRSGWTFSSTKDSSPLKNSGSHWSSEATLKVR